MDIILIAGLWLPHTVWEDVARRLESRGHRPLPVALPGVDDGSTQANLADQVTAALEVIDDAECPMVVGHSAACTLAWITADQRADAIRNIVMIGGFPASDGEAYADFLPTVDGAVPFPGWEAFEGPDAADLGPTERALIEDMAVPVPAGISTGTVRLSNEKRFDLPVLLVCPEYSPEQARRWIEGGEVPELSRATSVSFVDIASGHWPMVTQPAALADILDRAATG